MTDLLKKMLLAEDAAVIAALIEKAEKGDVPAIKLIFELLKTGTEEPAAELTADLTQYTDAQLMQWVNLDE